jgi:hypothetical protein
MPSITTQTLSSAVSGIVRPVQNTIPAQLAGNAIATPSQTAQVLQTAADRATLSLKSSDLDRAPKIPKSTEGIYSSKKNRSAAEKARATSNEGSGEQPGSDEKLDVTA